MQLEPGQSDFIFGLSLEQKCDLHLKIVILRSETYLVNFPAMLPGHVDSYILCNNPAPPQSLWLPGEKPVESFFIYYVVPLFRT